MELRWSLDNLYTAFDSKEFIRDLVKSDTTISTFNLWVIKNTTDTKKVVKKLEEYIKINNDLSELTGRLLAFCNLTLNVDTKNQQALHNLEILEKKLTNLAAPSSKFIKWLGTIDNLNDKLEKSDLLKEHKFILMENQRQSKYILDEKEEVLISKLKNTGSNSWSKLKNLLVSNLLIDINIAGEDKKLPLPVIRNMAHEKDAGLRKKAYEVELNAYKTIEDSVAACLNSIKGESLTINKIRGYESILDETLINSRMQLESLNVMLSALKESLPAFRRFYKRKSELLGNSKALPFYDLFAPMGEVNMTYTYEEARDFIVSNFRTFSDKLADFAQTAFNKNWIDAEPREGKVGGAFCYNLHSIGESRIMTNFSGSFSDVITLAHELGHGYHGYCLNTQTELNSSYPMPIAETASTFCETIIKKAAIKRANKDEAFTILEADISDCGQVIVDIYSRYIFETELFKRREKNSLSADELKGIMLAAQKEVYGEGLDQEFLHPYMWLCKPHYYYTDSHFYNFPYAFGLLFAKGLYAEYLEKGTAFIDTYDKLLSITGKNNISDITKLVGININSIDFWRNSLKLIEKDIDEFIKLSK
ncbi:MAG: M3 family oligoendopeptidase [Clostridiaceae bacterium]|nr:M3 family oligoendopeptidase [Clostridiaceae bacterium]